MAVHPISTKQHGGIKSGVSQSKNFTISQVMCRGELSCWKVQKLRYPHKSDRFGRFLWL